MKAMVLAAGVGSRLDPLTSQVPKPLVPIANRPVMEHIYGLLKKHGITSVVSNLHYQKEKIQEYFGDGGKSLGMDLRFEYEQELTGDAGGMRACREFLCDDTFIVMMGDLVTDADLSKIIAEHKSKGALATIALKQVPDVSHFGVAVLNQDGFITGFQEKPSPQEALSNRASFGSYVLDPKFFDYVPQSGVYGFGRQLFPSLVAAGLPVLGASIDDYYWSDVGTIEQYWQSNLDALTGKVNIKLPGKCVSIGYIEEGARAGDNLHVDGILMLGRDSEIGSRVKIKGTVIIADSCRIDDGVELTDTVIWSNSRIESKANLKGCVVGANCLVAQGSTYKNVASISWPPPRLNSVQEIEA